MKKSKMAGQHKLIQLTNKSTQGIEAHNKVKLKSLKDLRGTVTVKVHGDINESVFPKYPKP